MKRVVHDRYRIIGNFLTLNSKLKEFIRNKSSNNYEEFQKFIMQRSTIVTMRDFITITFGKLIIRPQELFMCYIIVHYNDNFLLRYRKDAYELTSCNEKILMNNLIVRLKSSSIDILDKFNDIIENVNSNKKNEIYNYIDRYRKVHYEWKKLDLKEMLDSLSKSYCEAESINNVISISVGSNLDKEMNERLFRDYRSKIIRNFLMLGIDEEKAMEYINNYKNNDDNCKSTSVNYDDTVELLTNVYWDVFREEMNENPPKLTRIPVLVEEIRNKLNDNYSNGNNKIIRETNKILSKERVMRMIDIENGIDVNIIREMIEYIIHRIMQRDTKNSRNLDFSSRNLEEWVEHIYGMMYNTFNYSDLLVNFFSTVFYKLDK